MTNAIEFGVDDPDQFGALYEELRGTSGLRVEAVQTPPAPGEQGALVDLLTVACSSGAVTALLGIVRSLVDSRGPGFALKVRGGGTRLEITADNVEDALPMLAKLLDGA